MSPITENLLKSHLGAGHGPGAKIEHDLSCAGCGYNLRGLTYGRNCPECGQAIRRPAGTGPIDDVVGSGDVEVRRRFQIGFGILTACLAAAVAARWTSLGAALFVLGETSPAYFWFLAVNGAVWCLAVWMTTPPLIDRVHRRLRPLRLLVRATQFAWPIALAVYAYARLGTTSQATEDQLVRLQFAGRFVGGAGVIMAACLWHALAERADLEAAPRRMLVAAWLLPIATAIVAAFPAELPWIWVFVLILALVLWSWIMWLFALGTWELSQHAGWSIRSVQDGLERERRVMEKRAEMESAAAASVRPIPRRDAGDLPIE